jgi:hypothetical protein
MLTQLPATELHHHTLNQPRLLLPKTVELSHTLLRPPQTEELNQSPNKPELLPTVAQLPMKTLPPQTVELHPSLNHQLLPQEDQLLLTFQEPPAMEDIPHTHQYHHTFPHHPLQYHHTPHHMFHHPAHTPPKMEVTLHTHMSQPHQDTRLLPTQPSLPQTVEILPMLTQLPATEDPTHTLTQLKSPPPEMEEPLPSSVRPPPTVEPSQLLNQLEPNQDIPSHTLMRPPQTEELNPSLNKPQQPQTVEPSLSLLELPAMEEPLHMLSHPLPAHSKLPTEVT